MPPFSLQHRCLSEITNRTAEPQNTDTCNEAVPGIISYLFRYPVETSLNSKISTLSRSAKIRSKTHSGKI